MKKVNSISGGRSSGYLTKHFPADYDVFALVCLDDPACAPKDKAIVDYVNQKLSKYTDRFGEFIATAEDDDTLVALMDLEQYTGREITWVRGQSFDEILRTPSIGGGNPTRLPNKRFRYCTFRMKLIPIFEWWFINIGEKVQMRIGFRFDEFSRIEKFFNNSNPTNFEIPVRQRTYGQKKVVNQIINWRECVFPLAKNGIIKQVVDDYWDAHGYIGSDSLFSQRRQIKWPKISNCTICHIHQLPELAIMSQMHPPKFQWAIRKENAGMGTWLDSKLTYQEIMNNAENWIPEMIREGVTCTSGGCTD